AVAAVVVSCSAVADRPNRAVDSVERSFNAVVPSVAHNCYPYLLVALSSEEHRCNPVLLSVEHSRNAVLLSVDHSCNPYPYANPLQRPTDRTQTATLSTESPQLFVVAFLHSLPKSHGVG